MKTNQKNYFLAVILWGLCLTCGSLVWADGNPNDYLHARTYLGVVGTSVSVSNASLFNGQNYSRLNTPNYEVDLIPSLNQSFGLGVLIGHREEAYAMEVSYWQSTHTASFGPATVTSATVTTPTYVAPSQDTAVYNSVNVDFKRYFLTDLDVQPFLNLGVSFPWIVVNNAAEGPSTDANGNPISNYIGSLTLAGLGLNLGIGVEYYLTPTISVVGGGYERWASFDQTQGSISSTKQFNQLAINGNAASDDGSGLIFMVGTTIGFQ